MKIKIKIKKILISLSDPRIFFFATFWLMILLFFGTIAQRDIGLYQAQVRYFNSFVLWLGFIPLPGGATAMAIIFVGLLSKLVNKTTYSVKKMGTAITHLGSFLLLAGGLLTGIFSFEGNMVIPEGDTVSHFKDYHKLEVAIIDTSATIDNTTYAFGDGFLEQGKELSHGGLPFKIKVLNYCGNCSIVPNDNATDSFIGFAKRFKIVAKPAEKEDSENRSGMLFKVIGSEEDGTYMVVESMPVTQTITAQGKRFSIDLRHKRYQLPFKIELLDFEKKNHASTGMAKSYKSIINLIDKDLTQRTVVQMNEPLRYQGYTFYQSSFVQAAGGETTIFAVVKNVGRLFPYISSLIICFGLMIHLLMNAGKLFTQQDNSSKEEVA